jgi:hypothetical protein
MAGSFFKKNTKKYKKALTIHLIRCIIILVRKRKRGNRNDSSREESKESI